jgi:hypothetical protein
MMAHVLILKVLVIVKETQQMTIVKAVMLWLMNVVNVVVMVLVMENVIVKVTLWIVPVIVVVML